MESNPRDTAAVRADLIEYFAKMLEEDPAAIDPDVSFLDLGLESYFLLEASQALQAKYEVEIPFRMMMEELSGIGELADYIVHHLAQQEPGEAIPAAQEAPAAEAAPSVEVPQAAPTPQAAAPQPQAVQAMATLEPSPTPMAAMPEGNSDELGGQEWIMNKQLDLMSQQLHLLRSVKLGGAPVSAAPQTAKAAASSASTAAPAQQAKAPASTSSTTAPAASGKAANPGYKEKNGIQVDSKPFVAYRPPEKKAKRRELNDQQQAYLDQLIDKLSTKTAKSKALNQKYRYQMADNRTSAGFKHLYKEMFYQILIERGCGSHIWDVDGNEFIDISMGFGALLFGHSPELVMKYLKQAVDNGITLGPQSHLAGEVAALVCELTGIDRVTFTNCGTEAVMAAFRVARTVTKREKIVLFAGSFHGCHDPVLVTGIEGKDGQMMTAAMSPGVPKNIVKDMICLEFGGEGTIDAIRKVGSEVAAIIVEPMPSRRPGEETQEFLQACRDVATEIGACLIFDEVVTGFRVHPGGAQKLFDIEADLVTYGKAVGAGTPIGMIGGKAKYMDALDGGGKWQFGDDSGPSGETTFFAGTFWKHPHVMAAVKGVMETIKSEGPQMVAKLNQATTDLVNRLNQLFESENVLIRAFHICSMFRFTFDRRLKHMDLFYYALMEKGIYTLETRNCFLSTAHTQADCDTVVEAVKAVIADFKAAGLLADNATQAQQDAMSAAIAQ